MVTLWSSRCRVNLGDRPQPVCCYDKTTQFPSQITDHIIAAAATDLWFAVSLNRALEVRGGCCGVAAVAMVVLVVVDDAGNDIYKQLAGCMGRS